MFCVTSNHFSTLSYLIILNKEKCKYIKYLKILLDCNKYLRIKIVLLISSIKIKINKYLNFKSFKLIVQFK